MALKKDNSNKRAYCEGFTLIEIMVAAFILVVIILIMAKIFHQSSVAWSSGMRKADGNMAGRSAVAFMSRELMNAAGDPLYFKLDQGCNVFDKHELSFVTLIGAPHTAQRVARRITYSFQGNEVVRGEEFASYKADGVQWSRPPSLVPTRLVENVKSFEVEVPKTYLWTDGVLPPWVKIKLVIKRGADISSVGAASAGPDGKFNTKDDIEAF